MKVTQEKLPASQVGLEIEITPEMSKEAYEKTIKEFTRNANIPGFRRGKVPRQVLIQRFGSSRIKATVVEELIDSSLKKAIEQEKIDAIGNFQLKSSFEDLVNQFEPGSTLTFTAAVDVPPEVTLDQYKGLQVQAEESRYDPKRVEEVLEDYRNRSATLVPVEGRAAQAKDIAVVDFSGRFLSEEDSENTEPQEIPGSSAQDFEIELTEGRFIAGFVDGIIGMNLGETKELSVTFPEDYGQEELAGKPALFTVTLKELKEKELPELDDDFAQDVSEFETMAELRESLESQFQKKAEEQTRANQETALLDELIKHIHIELPETLIKREVDFMLNQTMMQFNRQGMDVKRLFTDEIIVQLRERSRPDAIDRLKRTLALGKIAELESIKAEPEEIDAKVDEFLEDFPEQQNLDSNRLRSVLEEDLLKEKILDWLLENCTVELVPEGTLKKAEETKEAEDMQAVEGSEADPLEPSTEPEAITTASTQSAIETDETLSEVSESPEETDSSSAAIAEEEPVDLAEDAEQETDESAPKNPKASKRKTKASKSTESEET